MRPATLHSYLFAANEWTQEHFLCSGNIRIILNFYGFQDIKLYRIPIDLFILYIREFSSAVFSKIHVPSETFAFSWKLSSILSFDLKICKFRKNLWNIWSILSNLPKMFLIVDISSIVSFYLKMFAFCCQCADNQFRYVNWVTCAGGKVSPIFYAAMTVATCFHLLKGNPQGKPHLFTWLLSLLSGQNCPVKHFLTSSLTFVDMFTGQGKPCQSRLKALLPVLSFSWQFITTCWQIFTCII